ncbi:MAG: hypothetical protein IJX50_05775 [Clostridia bacterium]|nr:hypothetical protein [Clostridia bacterium]
MKYPYLPEKKVSVFIADAHINGAIVIKPPAISVLPEGLMRHADLGICMVSEKKAVCPPETCAYYSGKLSHYAIEVISGKSNIGSNYPNDSAYNVGIVGKKCFLNKSVCDEHLYEILISEGYEIINVKQGYTKCSICPVDEVSFITGDKGIAAAGEKAGLSVLLISNDNISLSGYPNGFFGGCTGMGASDELLINGDINTLPDHQKIKEFLEKRKIRIKSIKEGEVTDIGSIIPLTALNES